MKYLVIGHLIFFFEFNRPVGVWLALRNPENIKKEMKEILPHYWMLFLRYLHVYPSKRIISPVFACQPSLAIQKLEFDRMKSMFWNNVLILIPNAKITSA